MLGRPGRLVWLALPALLWGCHLIFPFERTTVPASDGPGADRPAHVDAAGTRDLPADWTGDAPLDQRSPEDQPKPGDQDAPADQAAPSDQQPLADQQAPPDQHGPSDQKVQPDQKAQPDAAGPCDKVTLDTASPPVALSVAGATWSHTTNCTGACLLLVVVAGENVTGSKVLYDGTALTRIEFTSAATRRTELWLLDKPTSKTATIALTLASTGTPAGFAGSSTWRCASAAKSTTTSSSGCHTAKGISAIVLTHTIGPGVVVLDGVSTSMPSFSSSNPAQVLLWGSVGYAASSHTLALTSTHVRSLGWYQPLGGTADWARCWIHLTP